MSQVMQEPKASYIYKDSVEVAKDNPDKRFFKIFLINNSLTRTINKNGLRFKVENVDVLDRDVDTFIGRTVIPFNKDKKGKHVDPKDEGIFQHRYASKADYVSAANTYYDKHGKATIIATYKPDSNLLTAARTNPNKIVNYDALAETTDPDLVRQLDVYEKGDGMMYVSPGLVALDSYYTDDGIKIVTQFAATHAHIVDEPAFTEPVAYIHKRICNVDHKTCYFDLLTAAEEKDLFNNVKDKKDMSSNNTGEQGAGITQIGEDLGNIENLNSNDQTGIQSKTEIADSKGNIQKVERSNDQSNNVKKEQQKKVENNKKGAEAEVEKIEKTEKTEKIEKVEEGEQKEAPLTASELSKILDNHSTKIMELVEEKQNQKLELQAKTNVLGKYIDNKNEELKESYDFYNTLPITSDQLARILEDSKYNTQLLKNGKRAVELTASSYNGIRTSRNTNPSKINDTNKSAGGNRGDSEIHYDNTGGQLGKYR